MQSKTYLNRYRLHADELGLPLVLRRTATEATFKAQDLASNQDVALQVIPVGHLSLVAREQLGREALDAKKLSHINIPALQEFGLDGDHFVYVTDYFEGTTAEEWVKAHGPIPVGAVLRIASQSVSALAAAAFHGIFHHAFNPANIMLVPGQTNEGEWPLIKVLNLAGLAPKFSRSQASAAGVAEPINFASPEQLETGTVDFRSEIYSLGCTLWFLLSGVPPLAGATTVEHASGVPGPVRRLLARMLAENPEERPLDPIALQDEIRSCLGQAERREAVASKIGLPMASTTTPLNTAPRRAIPV